MVRGGFDRVKIITLGVNWVNCEYVLLLALEAKIRSLLRSQVVANEVLVMDVNIIKM